MVNIFIANLDWSITSEDLNTTFSSFGTVHYAHVVYEKESRKSRGYGYVEMESAESAIAAIEALNGMEINGRAIDVKIASPKSNRPKKEEKQESNAPKKPFMNNRGGQGNNNRDRRPYNNNGGERRPYNNNGGERRPYNNNGGGERRPYNNNGGERRPYNNDGGERRSYNNDGGERRSYNNEGGERRPYNNDGGERRSYNNDRPERSNNEETPRYSSRVEPTQDTENGDVKRVLRPRRNKQ